MTQKEQVDIALEQVEALFSDNERSIDRLPDESAKVLAAELLALRAQVEKQKQRGELFPKNTFMLRTFVGSAKGDKEYEMTLSTGMNPTIMSKATGQYFSLKWQDIIEMAIDKGIDTPLAAIEKEAGE